MEFPSSDKLRRAKEAIALKGIKPTDENYWDTVCDYYEQVLGGKVLQREVKELKEVNVKPVERNNNPKDNEDDDEEELKPLSAKKRGRPRR